MVIQVDSVLDAKGLACPMPIVRTKKAFSNLEPGQVLEILATDKGSRADLEAWAKSSGHQYLGTLEDGEVLKHYLRKANTLEEKEDKKFPHIIENEVLQKKLENSEKIIILDVREQAEYSFGHIPGAISIPLAELEDRMGDLNKESEILIVCRSGNRSDLACKQLFEKGFNVKNVVQGMVEWSGPIEKNN
ncbi:SirA-like domain-containing protein [Bacillus freudenreichii]|nr:SirA-like domain-containing protein [Bacillus freudenreichii]